MNTESYGTRAKMKQLLEFLPLIIFVIVFQMSGDDAKPWQLGIHL